MRKPYPASCHIWSARSARVYLRMVWKKAHTGDREKYRKRVDLDMKTELELGLGIEEFIQISITANFAMENYYGKTNPCFYKTVMSYYTILEEKLASFQIGQDERFTALEEAANKHQYNECLRRCKIETIEAYLQECQKIVETLELKFDCDAWYKAQRCTNTVQERAAIINLMSEIRKLEEIYMEGANTMNTRKNLLEKKEHVFDHLRHGQSPRVSDLGGYMPYKDDMENDGYFLAPDRLRSILGIFHEGDA